MPFLVTDNIRTVGFDIRLDRDWRTDVLLLLH